MLVLGTEMTMKSGLYSEELQKRGIEAIIPNEQVQKDIQHLILNEIILTRLLARKALEVATNYAAWHQL